MNHNRNLAVEAVITGLAALALALGAAYATQVWHAADDEGHHLSPPKSSIIPFYGLLPLVTILLSLADIALYITGKIGPRYAVIMSAIMAPMWLTMVTMWSQCHQQMYAGADNVWEGVCYQSYIGSSLIGAGGYAVGVSPALGRGVNAAAALVMITYIGYLVLASIDFHRSRKRGPGQMGRRA